MSVNELRLNLYSQFLTFIFIVINQILHQKYNLPITTRGRCVVRGKLEVHQRNIHSPQPASGSDIQLD